MHIFDEGASLTGNLFDKILIVENNALEIVTAVAELPQFLVNGCLVVKNGDDKFFIDIFSRISGILQYFLGLFEMNKCKFKFLFLVDIDFIFGVVGVEEDVLVKLFWNRRKGTFMVDELEHLMLGQ